MSVSESGVVLSAGPANLPAANRENLAPPVPWTVAQNWQQKSQARAVWTEQFQENVDRVSAAVAESLYNQFSRKLSLELQSPFATNPTSDEPFQETYRLSFRVNPAQMKEWAGDQAEQSPLKAWFDHYISLQKLWRNQLPGIEDEEAERLTTERPKTTDHTFIENCVDVLGQRVATWIERRFAEFRLQDGNQDLNIEVKWHPKDSGGFLLSKGPFCPYLHVSAWVHEKRVSDLEKQSAEQVKQLRAPAPKPDPSPVPGGPPQAQPVSELWSGIRGFFARVFYPLLWLIGKA